MLAKEELVKEISHAFRGVQLDGGLSLNQTKVVDNYGRGCTTEEFTALPSREVIDDWTKIPASVLDAADTLAHLDRRGFRYYIPALMLRLLENYDPTTMRTIGTLSILYPRDDSSKYLYTLLSAEQKSAVANFLEALPGLVELDNGDTKIVPRAIRNYWSQFLE